METIILGAGISGLSCSYHIGHDKCIIYEKNAFYGGHAGSYFKDGCHWDFGPHVSFTNDSYVKDIFEKSAQGKIKEYTPNISNYFQGSWISHPVQLNLKDVPEPLRTTCFENIKECYKKKMKVNRKITEDGWKDHSAIF